MRFLVYMYYTHTGYQTSLFGKNCMYYIQIFTVIISSNVVTAYRLSSSIYCYFVT